MKSKVFIIEKTIKCSNFFTLFEKLFCDLFLWVRQKPQFYFSTQNLSMERIVSKETEK